MMHKTYLPFKEDTLKEHFVQSKKDLSNIEKHISKYKKSIENYGLFESNNELIEDIRKIRQIEKDETFWTASSLMTIFHSPSRDVELQKLLTLAFGEVPPLDNFSSWNECLKGQLHLFFEPNLPSPKVYLNWLKNNIVGRNFIPYILEKTRNKKGDYRLNLEGSTNVDALLLNSSNGFAIIIEAKVLSDISYQVSYDSMRNQIIRNVDVMLGDNKVLEEPLGKRIADNSLFLLLTPKLFQENPRTRLYGYTFNEYKTNFQSICDDLKHRELSLTDCKSISERMSWITWEDLKKINSDCCLWLNENTDLTNQ
ncbi:MAG TPA: hypothetical protein VFC65_17880 [Prolixibacteraceae bacterium]|nr:hypothetical protein [Prolixibacteraceae bacterium]